MKLWDVIGKYVGVTYSDYIGLGGITSSLTTVSYGEWVACLAIARPAGLGQNTAKICACD